MYFPPAEGDAWEQIDPAEAGWDVAALDAVATWAAGLNTTTLLIAQGGRLLLERYFAGAGLHATSDLASAQKSVTSFLTGVAQEQGLLRIEDPVARHLGDGWSKAQPEKEALITVRHLLTMTSGLNDQWEYEVDAGTKWYYNNPAYHLTKRVIERASGQSIQQYLDAALRSIGLRETEWRERPLMRMPDGVPMTGLFMSARDAARFGLLMLANSAWAGEDVLRDKAYLRDSTNSSQELNPSYGYLWWLNGKATARLPGLNPPERPGPLIPTAPDDLYAAMGAGDQRIYVVPSLELVVVRQGTAAYAQAAALSSFDADLWQRIMQAAPA
jgi:CubicO group peptidase (beta-lactamase class C family)